MNLFRQKVSDLESSCSDQFDGDWAAQPAEDVWTEWSPFRLVARPAIFSRGALTLRRSVAFLQRSLALASQFSLADVRRYVKC